MESNRIEQIEKKSFDNAQKDDERKDRLKALNEQFKSDVKEINGRYGMDKELSKDNTSIKLDYSDSGNAVKEYYNGNKLIKTVERIGDRNIKTIRFDDNGKPFIKEISDIIKGSDKVSVEPNSEIVRGNFSAKTDQFGRTVESKMLDVQLKDGPRESLNRNLKNEAYKPGDDIGHLMSDFIGGSNTAENVVPQNYKVNRSTIKKVENTIKKLKNDGYKVDYEIKTNYTGSNLRPTSFEPSIKVNGQDFNSFRKIPGNEKYGGELKKIYNQEKFAKGEMGVVEKTVTDIGEKVGLNHEYGIESGAIAGITTATISTVDNVKDCIEGKTTVEEAAENITKDTGKAVVVGYGSGFVTKAVSSAMSGSSNKFISSICKLGVPAAVVSFAVSSYNYVKAYSEGDIDGKELAYNLGEIASGVVGSMGGTAIAGSLIAGGTAAGATGGSIIPGAGTIAGAVLGCIGGMVGYALLSLAYKTVVWAAGKTIDAFSDETKELEDKAKSLEDEIMSYASEIDEDAAKEIMESINLYKEENELPF